ncbi:MAG: hypothetical protein HY232_11895 [Acidobacteria bacterium]|nr:hypothetical protein [Acidobacteriota bacterium]
MPNATSNHANPYHTILAATILLFILMFEIGAGMFKPEALHIPYQSLREWPLSEMTFFSPIALYQYLCGSLIWGAFMLISKHYSNSLPRRRLGLMIIAVSLAPSFIVRHTLFLMPGLFSLWWCIRSGEIILFIIPLVSFIIFTTILIYILLCVVEPKPEIQIKL